MQRFLALDSWRGLCACFVALFHFHAFSHLDSLPFVRNSYLFVDFFFVLSGFVIAANYQERLLSGFGLLRFMLLRFGRLYPLHLATLLLYIGVRVLQVLRPSLGNLTNSAPFSPQESPETIVAHLLLIHGLHVFDFLTWNLPSWSISTEFYTYLVFAVLLVLLRNRVWIALLSAILLGPIAIGLLSTRGMDVHYDYGFIRCLYGFAAGVITFNVFVHHKLRSGTALEIGAVVAVVGFVSVAGRTLLSIAAPYVFALTIYIFAFESGVVSKFLQLRHMIFLGTVSYSIYMMQAFIASVLGHVAKHVQGAKLVESERWLGDLYYFCYLGVVLFVSYFTFRWIEAPRPESGSAD